MVLRHRLFQRLAEADAVTVVSAPAGSGKTSLLRSWIADAGLGGHAGWSTVQRDERDGQRFWRSVRDALAGVAGGGALAGRAGLAVAVDSEVLVERLLSDLRSLSEPAVLVIDDLHELHSDDALASLELFLTRRPEHLRVVLLTRAALGLGLHRLRLTGALTELRAEDLRFSAQETRELLETSGIALSDAAVVSLHERTEGWAAGLRLAAGSLAGHPDPESFVSEFCGTERTVAGYLLAEVLERQPPEVRDLLLRTSVLERISGPLADALTGGSGSERILHELESANMFVTALDVGRSWFRYHPLFADLLRLELRRVNPTLVRPLHAAAARWHEQHGDVVEAIRHAQAAGDWPHAARLLADNQLELILGGYIDTVRALLDAFPADVPTTDPELALAFALARLYEGQHEEAAAHVAVAERLADGVGDDRRRRFELGLAVATLLVGSRGRRPRPRAGRVAPRGGRVAGAAAERRPRRSARSGHGAAQARHRADVVAAVWTTAVVTSRKRFPWLGGSDGPISRWRASATWPSRRRSAACRSPSGAGSPKRRSRSPKPTDGTPVAMPRRHWPPPAPRSHGSGGSQRPSGVWTGPSERWLPAGRPRSNCSSTRDGR